MTTTPIVVATHTDHQLHVFTRDATGAVSQVGQLVTSNGITPAALAAVVADLTDLFEWHALTPPPAPPKPKALPTSTPTRAKAEAERKRSARRSGMSQGVDRRERLLTRLRERHPEPCSAADFATALLPGESKTGALHMSLEWLVGHGLATRSGEPGAYRWSLVPAEEVTP